MGFSVCHASADLFKKGTWRDVFSKREDDNGLNRQLGKPRIVYDPFFVVVVGGGEGGRSVVQTG